MALNYSIGAPARCKGKLLAARGGLVSLVFSHKAL